MTQQLTSPQIDEPLVILVDTQDNQIGVAPKMQVHLDGTLHRAFSVFVFNSKGELMLQQRAFEKYHSGGLWTNTCCSHPAPGETNEQAAHRRLVEEMGFDCALEHAFSFLYRTDFENGLTEHEYDHVFFGHAEPIPQLNPEEVADYRWVSLAELDQWMADKPEDFTFWFKHIYDRVKAHLAKAGAMPKFRLLFCVLMLLAACKPKEQQAEEQQVVHEPTLLYGLVIDSLQVAQEEVRKGDNLSVILNRHGLSGQVVQQVVNAAKGIFDVRAIRVGQAYTTIKDSSALRYWIYEKDLVSYFIFDFTDSLPKVQRFDRPIETHLRSLGGVINSSLFKTVLQAGATQELAVRLAGVFDWTVDFFSLQKGDYFRVVYEEKTVEGKPYGTGKIIAAEFFHRSKPYYAILWENGKENQYYNENGESMRKRYLKAPLEYSRISSNFSSSRLHPVLKTRRPHLGVDYAAPTGTPIRAIGDGVVLEAGYRGGNGNFVKLKHNKNHATGYLHMSRIAPGIRAGVRVSQGQVIGYVGSTGLSTGPHLCFRFWENGVQVNPNRIQTPPADPLPAKDRPAYFAHRDSVMVLLNKVEMPTAE